MRVFVAGASGAVGTRCVHQLVERGHEVVGTLRRPGGAERVRALGAEPVALDLLDAAAVHRAVLGVKPDAIIHQATALATGGFSKKLDRTFAQTNRLASACPDQASAPAQFGLFDPFRPTFRASADGYPSPRPVTSSGGVRRRGGPGPVAGGRSARGRSSGRAGRGYPAGAGARAR
jgi:hypothetical protein